MNCYSKMVCALRPDGSDEVRADGDSDNEEMELGERKVVKMSDPKKPNKEEIAEHEMTHLPYRNWCKHCVRGRGKEMAHRKTEDKPEMTEVHIDFAFMGEEDKPGETIPILVAKERSTRMCMAAATPRKTTGDYIAKRLMAFLKEVGCAVGDMTIKADQEPALSSIIEALSKIRATEGGGRLVVENSPVAKCIIG